MPDECVRELMVMYDYAKEQTQKISLFGCSMGAYFQLLTFADIDIDRVWFLSPVTDIETLYFPYYEYVCKHPITNWPHETYILRGEMDTLSEYSYGQIINTRR